MCRSCQAHETNRPATPWWPQWPVTPSRSHLARQHGRVRLRMHCSFCAEIAAGFSHLSVLRDLGWSSPAGAAAAGNAGGRGPESSESTYNGGALYFSLCFAKFSWQCNVVRMRASRAIGPGHHRALLLASYSHTHIHTNQWCHVPSRRISGIIVGGGIDLLMRLNRGLFLPIFI